MLSLPRSRSRQPRVTHSLNGRQTDCRDPFRMYSMEIRNPDYIFHHYDFQNLDFQEVTPISLLFRCYVVGILSKPPISGTAFHVRLTVMDRPHRGKRICSRCFSEAERMPGPERNSTDLVIYTRRVSPTVSAQILLKFCSNLAQSRSISLKSYAVAQTFSNSLLSSSQFLSKHLYPPKSSSLLAPIFNLSPFSIRVNHQNPPTDPSQSHGYHQSKVSTRRTTNLSQIHLHRSIRRTNLLRPRTTSIPHHGRLHRPTRYNTNPPNHDILPLTLQQHDLPPTTLIPTPPPQNPPHHPKQTPHHPPPAISLPPAPPKTITTTPPPRHPPRPNLPLQQPPPPTLPSPEKPLHLLPPSPPPNHPPIPQHTNPLHPHPPTPSQQSHHRNPIQNPPRTGHTFPAMPRLRFPNMVVTALLRFDDDLVQLQ